MNPNPRHAALRARIAWPCFAIRAAATGYLAWALARIAAFWWDADGVARAFAPWYGGQLAAVDEFRRMFGLGLSLAVYALALAAVVAVWRVTAAYLDGRVFSVDAAIALKRVGQFGIAAAALDILFRPVIRALLSPGGAFDADFLTRWLRPEDLLYAAVFAAVWVMGHVLESAASLSDEVEQFV